MCLAQDKPFIHTGTISLTERLAGCMLCHWCVLVLSWLCIGFVMVVHYVIHSCRILNIDPNKHTAFATQHWDFPPLPSYSPLGVGDYDWVTHFLWISALVPRECNIPALEGKGGHFSRTQPLSSPSHHQNHTLVLEGTQQEVHSLLIISVKKIRILTDLVLWHFGWLLKRQEENRHIW